MYYKNERYINTLAFTFFESTMPNNIKKRSLALHNLPSLSIKSELNAYSRSLMDGWMDSDVSDRSRKPRCHCSSNFVSLCRLYFYLPISVLLAFRYTKINQRCRSLLTRCRVLPSGECNGISNTRPTVHLFRKLHDDGLTVFCYISNKFGNEQ